MGLVVDCSPGAQGSPLLVPSGGRGLATASGLGTASEHQSGLSSVRVLNPVLTLTVMKLNR